MRIGVQLTTRLPIVLLCAALFALAGCGRSGSQTDRDHEHEHPTTFVAAVRSIEKQCDIIRDAFTSRNPEAGHDALHEIGLLLEDVPELVGKTDLPATDQEEVSTAVEDLMDAYTKLDMSMHDGPIAKYQDVSDAIEAGMALLNAKVAASGEPNRVHAESDHDEADHAEAALGDAQHDLPDDHDHGDQEHGADP